MGLKPNHFWLSIGRACCIALLLFITGCDQGKVSSTSDLATEDLATEVFVGPIMGTEYRVSVVTKRPAELEGDALGQMILDSLTATNRIMSHYDEQSELSRLNRSQGGIALSISNDLMTVLRESKRIYGLSGGAFDVTLSPAINAWGFGPAGKIENRPSTEQLREIANSVGSDKFSLTQDSLVKDQTNLQFNLSAIAKGYAIDKLSEQLIAAGHTDFLINIGGELYARGHNQEGNAWRVGIEQPHVLGGLGDVLALSDLAIATSGDYRNYIELDGRRYSHTIDPETLSPVLHRLASVSVVHESAMTADALATAILALGDEAGIEFAREQNLIFYALIREQEDTFSIQMSDSLKPLIR